MAKTTYFQSRKALQQKLFATYLCRKGTALQWAKSKGLATYGRTKNCLMRLFLQACEQNMSCPVSRPFVAPSPIHETNLASHQCCNYLQKICRAHARRSPFVEREWNFHALEWRFTSIASALSLMRQELCFSIGGTIFLCGLHSSQTFPIVKYVK